MDTLPPTAPRTTKVQRNQEQHANLLAEKRKSPGYVTATELLTEPKMNLTARGRRKLGKARVTRLVSTVEPKSVQDAIDSQVKVASITGLIRLMRKSLARAEKGRRVLEDLAPDSLFRPNVEREIGLEKLINQKAVAEYERRVKAAPVKDARNAPHVWARFWSLKPLELFYVGKSIFWKNSFCVAKNTDPKGRSRTIAPWRRVKTLRLVKGSKSHPIPGIMTGRVNNRVPNDGMTHFVGDNCPGGHQSMNIDHTPEAQPEHERTGPAN